jgi:hypothetical protein
LNAVETLFQSVLIALSSVGLAIILRNAPVIRGWVQEMKKPWACNVCLPLYLCFVMVGVFYGVTRDVTVLLAYLPAYALSFVILEKLARPPGPPHISPEFFNMEDDQDAKK